jgi:site-specific DNA recombinase
LHDLTPSRTLFAMASDMFRTAWDMRLVQADALKDALKQELIRVDRQIEQLVDRIVGSASGTAISAYETRIARLEKDKLIATEKLTTGARLRRPFDEMFELALAFLSSPWKLWRSERLEDKRTVLKLTFADRLAYHRNEGFRTPKTTLPFKVLGGPNMLKCEMAHPTRFELVTLSFGAPGGASITKDHKLSICTPQYPTIRHLNFLPSLSGPIALIS